MAGDDPGILANAAYALASFGEDIGAMMALVDRALALNPNFARGWHISGFLRLWAGEPESAIEHVETSLRLSPRARTPVSLPTLSARRISSARRFEAGRTKAALRRSRTIRASRTRTDISRRATPIWAGSTKRERSSQRLRAVTSVVIPDANPLRNPEHRELLLSGLRLAVGERRHEPDPPSRCNSYQRVRRRSA